MISILTTRGHELIPKTIVEESQLASMKADSLGVLYVDIEELEALGERHLGCGHDL